jgi:hypothetical protein
MAMPPPVTPKWMRPLWVRLLLCVVPAVWAAFEMYHGNDMWALMFAIVAGYGFWAHIIQHRPPEA